MYLVGVGYILEVVVSVFSNCISSKNNFFEDQNHRAPVISFLKIEAPIQKIPYRPRFFLLPVTLLFIRNRNSHSMDYYRLKKKSPEILLWNKLKLLENFLFIWFDVGDILCMSTCYKRLNDEMVNSVLNLKSFLIGQKSDFNITIKHVILCRLASSTLF